MSARGSLGSRSLFLAAFLCLGCLGLAAQPAEAQDGALVRWAAVDGIAVRYLDTGPQEETSPRRTILLVHGFCGAGSHFEQLFPFLADAGRCVAVDLPGCAGSEKPDADYSVAYFVSFLDSFCRTLGLTSVILVGHSMGGQIAVHFTRSFPDRVDRLVLLAPDGLAGEEGIWLALTELGPLLEAGFSRTNRSMVEIALRTVIFGDTTAVRPEVVDTFASQLDTVEGIRALAAITRDVIGHDPVDDILPLIPHETLVLWGDGGQAAETAVGAEIRGAASPGRAFHAGGVRSRADDGRPAGSGSTDPGSSSPAERRGRVEPLRRLQVREDRARCSPPCPASVSTVSTGMPSRLEPGLHLGVEGRAPVAGEVRGPVGRDAREGGPLRADALDQPKARARRLRGRGELPHARRRREGHAVDHDAPPPAEQERMPCSR